MFVRGKLRAKCSNCVSAGLSAMFRADYTWGDLHRVKCSEHHTVFTEKGWRLLKKVNLDIESLADLVPSAPRYLDTVDPDTPEFTIDFPDDCGNILFHSGMIRGYSYNKSVMPGEEFFARPSSPIDLSMQFSLPTKSLYRVYEVLGSAQIMNDMGCVLVMGDGFGYSSMITKAMLPDAKVFSWTLIDIPSSVQHCLRISKPPTHYALDMKIDISLTLEEVSDVGNPLFEEAFSRSMKTHNIDAIISEIEYKYSNQKNMTYQLIEMMWKARIKFAIIKYEINTFSEIKDAIEIIWRHYRNWKVIEVPVSGLHTGEVWLMIHSPREEMGEWKYLSQDSVNDLYKELRISHESMTRWSNSWNKVLNAELEKTGLVPYIDGVLDSWFQEANMIGWNSLDMTKIFYGIKTGRRPEKVLDMSGNPIYYMHFGMENILFIRLYVIAFSLLDEEEAIADELSEGQNWDMTWEREGISGGPRGVYQWAPALYKRNKPSLMWSAPNRDVIKRYLPVVRARFDRLKSEKKERKEKRSIMNRVERFIRFGYARGNNKPLHFPVTRIASYLVPSS
jgi:hypothetical protein